MDYDKLIEEINKLIERIDKVMDNDDDKVMEGTVVKDVVIPKNKFLLKEYDELTCEDKSGYDGLINLKYITNVNGIHQYIKTFISFLTPQDGCILSDYNGIIQVVDKVVISDEKGIVKYDDLINFTDSAMCSDTIWKYKTFLLNQHDIYHTLACYSDILFFAYVFDRWFKFYGEIQLHITFQIPDNTVYLRFMVKFDDGVMNFKKQLASSHQLLKG
jgi:hypothetical protein